jgi:hypothetical protein
VSGRIGGVRKNRDPAFKPPDPDVATTGPSHLTRHRDTTLEKVDVADLQRGCLPEP